MLSISQLPKPTDKYEEKAIADIEKHGVHILNVFDPDGKNPKFNYSVGFWHSFQHPEILIYGLDGDVSTRIINGIADKCRNGDAFPSQGTVSSDYIQGFDVCFVDVPKTEYKEHFGWARWLYSGDSFPVLQLIYPDKNDNWPWNENVHDDFKWFQPVLGGPLSET